MTGVFEKDATQQHDCTHHGHVWLETDGTPYTRHRGRTQADVPVGCEFCPAIRSLPAFSQHTAPPSQPLLKRERHFAHTTPKKRTRKSTGPVPKHR